MTDLKVKGTESPMQSPEKAPRTDAGTTKKAGGLGTRVVAIVLSVVMMFVGKFAVEAAMTAYRERSVESLKDRVRQGELLGAEDLTKSPRALWKQVANREVFLRSFERSAMQELEAMLPAPKVTGIGEEDLGEAARLWLEAEGALVVEEGVSVPAGARLEVFLTERSAVYLMGFTDSQSFGDSGSPFNVGWKEASALARSQTDESPQNYFRLAGWADEALPEDFEYDGAMLASATEDAFGVVIVYRMSASQYSLMMAAAQTDPGLQQIVLDEVDRAAKP